MVLGEVVGILEDAVDTARLNEPNASARGKSGDDIPALREVEIAGLSFRLIVGCGPMSGISYLIQCSPKKQGFEMRRMNDWREEIGGGRDRNRCPLDRNSAISSIPPHIGDSKFLQQLPKGAENISNPRIHLIIPLHFSLRSLRSSLGYDCRRYVA